MRIFDSVEAYTLPNGLQVITDHIPDHAMTGAAIIIASGPFHETGLTGAFHYLEHTIPHSHKTLSAYAYSQNVRRLAIKGELATETDHIRAGTAGRTSSVVAYLNMMAGMIGHGEFTPEHVRRERGRIMSEMSQRNSDNLIKANYAQAASFYGPGSPAARPRGGYVEDIKKITYDYLRRLREEHIVGANMMMISAGGLSHRRARGIAREYFGHLPMGRRQPRHQGKMHLQDLDLPMPELGNNVNFTMRFNASALHSAHPGATPLLENFLGQVLHEEMSLRRGMTYGVCAEFRAASRSEAVLDIQSNCKPEEFDGFVAVIKDILTDIVTDRKQFVQQFDVMRDAARNTMHEETALLPYDMNMRCDWLVRSYLEHGHAVDPRKRLKVIERIGYEEARQMLAGVLSGSHPVMTYMGQTQGLPGGQAIGACLGLYKQPMASGPQI